MRADLTIRNALVLDGTGAPPYQSDVAVTNGVISAVKDDLPLHGEVVDGEGLALSPGFIDVHTHDDVALILKPEQVAKVGQGVTTVVTGLCGYSAAPLPPDRELPGEYALVIPGPDQAYETFDQYLSAVAQAKPAVNYFPLVGHSSLRLSAMDDLDRPATGAEVERMAQLLEAALEAGAAGLSSGLAYSMAAAAPAPELIALCKRMAARRGLYVTHIRDEGDDLETSVKEALQIGQAAGVGVIFSHHKAIGAANFGRTHATLAAIDQARTGQEVGLDVYPYTYSSTALDAAKARRGGRVVVTRSQTRPDLAGRDLDDIAVELGVDRDTAIDALQPAGALYFSMHDDDVDRVMRHPLAMIGSDGLPFEDHPHPRLSSTFPRVLGHYVRDRAVLTLQEAIHRMTGLPARLFGLTRRGRIAPGYQADMVLFDPETIGDKATPTHPWQVPQGITRVWIAGQKPAPGTGRQLTSNRAEN